jgi:hypothetical protein
MPVVQCKMRPTTLPILFFLPSNTNTTTVPIFICLDWQCHSTTLAIEPNIVIVLGTTTFFLEGVVLVGDVFVCVCV